ncbi:MAG: PAS domain-containing protein [Chloroflexi bacterium]|nr:PAS domain-containing protein [Chloroflexota bacterium]
MEAWLVSIAALIGLAIVGTVAVRARRQVAEIRTAVAASGDPAVAVRALVKRAERTERARADDARARNEFIESLTLGVLTLDAATRIVDANSAAHQLVDASPGSLIGRTLIEAFIDTRVESIGRAALTVGSASGEVQISGADGTKLVVRARRAPTGGAWLVMEDVSELRRLQQIRTEFIDNLSHELRTPLTTVSLLAETLALEATDAGSTIPKRMRDRIGKIELETGHLVQMVTELLDLSRIESGGGLGLLDRLDLGQIAADSVERLRHFAERQDVTLEVERAANLPAVLGDESRLGQVVLNLVHNAVKFSPDGGAVRVSAAATDEGVVVAVTDHGVGIPRSAQDRIFERFYKVDRARVRGGAGGTGLGLAIARHIVEQHGGQIWVESTERAGSTFAFSVPVDPAPGS